MAQESNSLSSVEARNIAKAPGETEPAKPAEPKKINSSEIIEIQNALARTPDDWVLYNQLGVLYALRQRYDDALQALQTAAKINPNGSSVYYNLSVVYGHLDRRQDAIDAVQRSLTINPTYLKANQQLCELLSPDLQRSANCYQKLMEMSPNNVDYYSRYALALLSLKQTKEARAVVDKALRFSPENAEIQNVLGMLFFAKKRFSDAAAAFRHALLIDPQFTPARINLAIAEMKNGNRADAITQYGFVKDSDPNLAQQLYEIIYSDRILFVKDHQ